MPQDGSDNEWATMQARRPSTDEDWRMVKINFRRGTHVHGPLLSHHRFGFFVDLGEPVSGLVELPFITEPFGPRASPYSSDFPGLGTDIQAVVLDTVDHNRQVRLSTRPSDLARDSWEATPAEA